MLSLDEVVILRKKIRKQRRQLSRFDLVQAEHRVLTQILKLPQIQNAQHIGLYLDAFGEVPTQNIIRELLKRKKQVYLPVVCSMNQKLYWKKISFSQLYNQRFYTHRLGMKQPMRNRAKTISMLDTVIMPLVIFDKVGHRVGMGGGYYDRTLAQSPVKPFRLGIAHDFQQAPQALQIQSWDQPLDAVCTPKKLYKFY